MTNNKLLIATHNSATGEKPGSFLSWLLTPFARCQSKTIKQQYKAGCRMFDIRVKWVYDSWRCAHGAWYTKRSAASILNDINLFPEKCYVSVTYEGRLKDEIEKNDFATFCNWLMNSYPNINWGGFNAKYSDKNLTVDWCNILPGTKWHSAKQGFLPLDGHHWQTIIPIPWLWNKIYTRKHKFDSETYTFVDFL